MTSATKRLRELLDEREVEWSPQDGPNRSVETRWLFSASSALFTEYEDGMTIMVISGAEWTPEQAITATLGPGTCKLTRASWDDGTCTWGCICSACDAHLEHETGIGYNFCPVCGRKVVSE